MRQDSIKPVPRADAPFVVFWPATGFIYPLSIVWPSGWTWGQDHSHYLMMIIGIYATLGVFLLMAWRDPDAHKSIIWFTVWSSVVHGAIMALQAISDPAERGHLIADVPALFLIAIVLGILMQMGSSDRVATGLTVMVNT